jgi:tetratricopeptide (TPR) repeat protein
VACLSKESAVILPALAWCVTAPSLSPGVAPDIRRRVRWVAPFAALVAAYLIVHGVVAPLSGVAVPYREAAGAAVVMVNEFVRLLVIPIGLTVDHQVPRAISWVTVAGAAGWMAGAAVVAIAVGRCLPLAALGGWLVAWTMAPMIPLALSTRVALVQEHRALLAVAGFGLIAGACAEAWRGAATSTRARMAVGLTAALLVGAYATLSWNRVGVWASEESLWRDAATKVPDSPLAHTWLGTLAQRRGESDLAIGEFQQALRADPSYAFAALAVARLHHERRERPAARAAYLRTLAIAPGSVQALAGLGLLAQEEGDLSAAAAMYREVLRIAPRDLATRNNLATIVLAQGDYRAARDEYRAVLALDPDQPRVLTNLGYALLALGEREAAIAELRRAAALNPADHRTAWYLGEALARGGEWAEAERWWRRAGDVPEAAAGLARLYERTGRHAEAVEASRHVVAVAPDTPAYAALRAEALARIGSGARLRERP